MVFLKKFLISDYSVVSKKGCFCPLLRNSYKDLPNFFCMRVEDISIHRLSQMFFLKRLLIQDYRGLSVQRSVVFSYLSFFQNVSEDLPNFLHECIEQKGQSFDRDGFSEKKLLIQDYRGLSVQKRCCFTFLPFSPQWL